MVVTLNLNLLDSLATPMFVLFDLCKLYVINSRTAR
jgi:hypothetical protein